MEWVYLFMTIVSAIAANDQADKQSNSVTAALQKRENDRKRQEDEVRRAGAAQMNEEARRAQADLALFDTMVGEFGGGRTTDRARNVIEVQNTERIAMLGNNSRLALTQLGFDGIANRSRADSQLASIDRPSVLGTALTIGDGYMRGAAYRERMDRYQNTGNVLKDWGHRVDNYWLSRTPTEDTKAAVQGRPGY